MSRRSVTRRLGGTMLASAALALSLLAAPAAHADEATDAPVTHDDHVQVDGNSYAFVNVLKNDTDPNGDSLAVCRIEVADDVPLFVDNYDGQLVVQSARNKSGTYTFTYYACDYDYLTPATVTVTVTKFPELKAAKVAGHPGRVKFTNPSSKKVVVLYGNQRQPNPDGQVGVAAHHSAVVSTKRHNLFYVAYVRQTGAYVSSGTVRNIAPARTVAPRQRATAFSARDLRTWRSAS